MLSPFTKEAIIMTFTVFGATGNTGSIVARTLLDHGEKVRLLARDPAKVADLAARGAEVRQGDVLDADAVRSALEGAKGAYLLLPPDPTSTSFLARGRTIAENFASALTATKTPHAVLLSSVAAHRPAGTGPIVSAHNAEQRLGEVPDTRFTFVRAAYFIENILANAHPIKADGVLPVFGGGADVRFPMIATRDIGKVSADALLAPPAANEIIELSGPEPYSLDDAARAAAKILGRDVKTVTLPLEKLSPTLQGFGFSADVANLYQELTGALGTGLVSFDGKGRTVHGTTTLEDVLRAGLGS
jgi:uncharacterized protein YbjT (DUF2867 family)